MQFQKLKLVGFKSFVEPTEMTIESGLSGIVGPNGCGKSNLVEALRFVMGESSYKAMRGAGMEDVIFAGSRSRPAHNAAEVTLIVEPGDQAGPTAQPREILRRIERDSGSAYRIDGREVRARDVQVLFADAATGTRSSAMVRQGQISELIAAKPEQRRAILEDAAGISGLHARRQEAERKLKAAEDNLARLDDVLGEIESRVASLRRQARQAVRYRGLSDEVRQAEARLLLVRHQGAMQALGEADAAMARAVGALAERMAAQVEAVRRESLAAQGLPGLRDTSAGAAAALQRVILLQEDLDRQESRAAERRRELDRLIGEAERDLEDENRSVADAETALRRLVDEIASLKLAADGDEDALQGLRTRCDAAAASLREAEEAYEEAARRVADEAAERRSLVAEIADCEERSGRLAQERADREAEIGALATSGDAEQDLASLNRGMECTAAELDACEERRQRAEQLCEKARRRVAAAEEPFDELHARVRDREAEIKALRGILAADPDDGFTPVMESVSVDSGYELALAAALGDDLDAATDPAAPVRWLEVPASVPDSPLPENVRPLAEHVRAPAALARRLSAVGVAEPADAQRLSARLSQGHRLVTREGAMWRWDGYHREAGAPSVAARRLEQRNRLAGLEGELEAWRTELAALRAALEAESERRVAAERDEQAARESVTKTRRAHSEAQKALVDARQEATQVSERLGALREALARIDDALEKTRQRGATARAALDDLPPASEVGDAALEKRRSSLAEIRREATDARRDLDQRLREAQARNDRMTAVGEQRVLWEDRRARAKGRLVRLGARLDEMKAELAQSESRPEHFGERRKALLDEAARLERQSAAASDALAQAEQVHAQHARESRQAVEALASAREDRARAEAQLDAAREKREAVEREAGDRFQCRADGLWPLAGLEPGVNLPSIDALEDRLARLKREREKLGAVNLQAETEMQVLEARQQGLLSDKTDVEAAVRQLHRGIASLNREGRDRLTTAFEEVAGHFESLFRHLFGGGEAQLRLVGSDDPLEAGLEIIARPPGKRPQSMTLLSGGEQALTALALIFAVFLTNPSPICVLDEVDAPLDDANVERFCALLEDMRGRTATRFLVVTHNPITMARMDRLFGVTMAERGISQLVSVDLQTAEAYREAV